MKDSSDPCPFGFARVTQKRYQLRGAKFWGAALQPEKNHKNMPHQGTRKKVIWVWESCDEWGGQNGIKVRHWSGAASKPSTEGQKDRDNCGGIRSLRRGKGAISTKKKRRTSEKTGEYNKGGCCRLGYPQSPKGWEGNRLTGPIGPAQPKKPLTNKRWPEKKRLGGRKYSV